MSALHLVLLDPALFSINSLGRQAQYSDAGAPSVEELYNGSGGRNSPPAAQPKPLDNSNPDGKTMTKMSSSVLSNLAPSR